MKSDLNECPKCFYCEYEFGMEEERCHVRKSTKPKGSPYRWRKLGYVCEQCIKLGKEFQIEVIK